MTTNKTRKNGITENGETVPVLAVKAYKNEGIRPLIPNLCTRGDSGQRHQPATLPQARNPGRSSIGGLVGPTARLNVLE
jgi:hypothetical protein